MEDGATGSEVMEAKASDDNVTVTVKFSGRSMRVNVSPNSTVNDLKSLLQPLTNVLPRGQKLIFKGRILVDALTLRSSEVTNGSKIMLMASQGLHQGQGPVLKEASSRLISRKATAANSMENETMEFTFDKSSLERWRVGGVIALSQFNLKAIPDEVWSLELHAGVLDISYNSIRDLPAKISCLAYLEKVFLNSNDMSDDSISWEGLSSLKSLTILNMSHNHLTALPSALGTMTSLTQLYVANNKLTSLPTEIGLLTQLQVLKAENNRISTIPTSIGDCIPLIEIDLSANLLSELPETLGNLQNLKALHLSNNGLKSLPSTIFKMCSQLSTLDLHNTEITMDVLRLFEGWEDFDERRRLKQQKKLDFGLLDSAEFDEGADKN